MFVRRYKGQELARLFGNSPSWVSANLPRLMEEEGFPPPVRGTKNRWDAEAVDAWFRHELEPSAPIHTDRAEVERVTTPAVPLIERGAFRAALREAS